MVPRNIALAGSFILAAIAFSATPEARPALRHKAPGSALFVKIGSVEKKVADAAQKAWLIDEGREVLYSSTDGSGGYEREGQSLYIYDRASGSRRKVMSEYYVITGVTEVKTAAGKRALLVRMMDGGLGASYFSVVDPARGEVFFASGARMTNRKINAITLGSYKDEDWDELRANHKVRPYKTRTYDLDELLRKPVIVNKRSR